MWQIATFQPTSLFTLRPTSATSSGGKTLVTPTPFALKMALVDVAIRSYGRARGEQWFPAIRDLRIAARLSMHLAVVSTFARIRRPLEIKDKKKEAETIASKKADKNYPWDSNISFREFVQFSGNIELAFSGTTDLPLLSLLSKLNYLGRRGCFMQFEGLIRNDALPDGFTILNPDPNAPFPISGLLQELDDCGPQLTFAHADIYSGKEIKRNVPNGREIKTVVLPYKRIRSSRGFTLYERV